MPSAPPFASDDLGPWTSFYPVLIAGSATLAGRLELLVRAEHERTQR